MYRVFNFNQATMKIECPWSLDAHEAMNAQNAHEVEKLIWYERALSMRK